MTVGPARCFTIPLRGMRGSTALPWRTLNIEGALAGGSRGGESEWLLVGIGDGELDRSSNRGAGAEPARYGQVFDNPGPLRTGSLSGGCTLRECWADPHIDEADIPGILALRERRMTVSSRPHSQPSEAAPVTVIYDGQCKLCVRSVSVLRSMDRSGSLEFLANADPLVAERFPFIPPSDLDHALQVVGRDGKTWSGASAIEAVLRVLPRTGMLAWMFRLPFARTGAARLYAWVARRRLRFLGAAESCGCDNGLADRDER